ncbi:MAG: helix-turn-helix transcriptional regulator [Acutalibacteraceae bacterium]|nr:helix-turn-helix transcriptional regulator [Acutalibacteraceae bacterium]
MKELGLKLKYYRDNCELSQQQVANILNIDRSTYTYYETGKTTPSASMLLKLSKIYNVPCAVFLECINQELELNSKVADSVAKASTTNQYTESIDDKIYSLTKDEKDVVIAYRILDNNKKEELKKVIEELIRRN